METESKRANLANGAVRILGCVVIFFFNFFFHESVERLNNLATVSLRRSHARWLEGAVLWADETCLPQAHCRPLAAQDDSPPPTRRAPELRLESAASASQTVE